MECLLENGAEINFQRKFWKFHHLQLDRNEPDKVPGNILSGAFMFRQADHLGNLESSFSIWYSMKAHRFYYKPLVRQGSQWAWAVSREEKRGGRTNVSLGHQHFWGAQPSHAPCPPSSPNPPRQSPCTEKSLQAFIAFKNYLSVCLAVSWLWIREMAGHSKHPLWSTGILVPPSSHWRPSHALVVGSTITKNG